MLEIVDLLMGAAYADKVLQPEEEVTVKRLLGELLGEPDLPDDVAARIQSFVPADFQIARTAATFAGDPASEKRKLLELVAAVRDADDVVHLDEDDYIKQLAAAIGVPTSGFDDLVLDIEVEDLKGHVTSLRRRVTTPPPTPKK